MSSCASGFYNYLNGGTFFSPVTNSNTGIFQFCPTPPMGLEISWERNEGNDRLIENRTYTLEGDILFNKGLNSPSGSQSRIEDIDKQIDLLRNAFSKDLQQWIIFDENGYVVINENPIVDSISFEGDNTWANHVPYTLVLRAEEGIDAGASGVKSGGESWSITQNEDGTVGISHTANAVGIATSTTTAFTNAKDFVLTKAGQNPLLQAFFISLAGKSAFNHSKSEEINKDEGSYSFTEQWLASSGSFIDDRQETITEERGIDGVLLVSASGITGTITGLSSTDDPNPSARFTAALNAFNNTVKGQIGWDTATSITTRQQTNNLLAGTLGYSIQLAPSGGANEFDSRTRTVSLERNDDGSTTETVTAAAQIKAASPSGVQLALDYVEANVFAENSTNPPFNASAAFKIGRGRETNASEKSASMTATYLDVGGTNYNEEFSVEVTTDENDNVTGRITGSIQGLGEEPTVTSTNRFTRALAAFNNPIKGLRLSRIQAAAPAGTTFNANFTAEVFGEARELGVVNYSASVNDKALPANVISETAAQINFSGGDAIFALISVPGRPDGPISQDMNTINEVTLAVNVTRTFKKGTSQNDRRDSVCARSLELAPAGSFPKNHKQTISHSDTTNTTSLNITATLTGSELDISWRCV